MEILGFRICTVPWTMTCSLSVGHLKDLVEYPVSLTVMDCSHLLHSVNYKISTYSTYPFLPLLSLSVPSLFYSNFSLSVSLLVFSSCLHEEFFLPIFSLFNQFVSVLSFNSHLQGLFLLFWLSLLSSFLPPLRSIVSLCFYPVPVNTHTHTLTHTESSLQKLWARIHKSNCVNKQVLFLQSSHCCCYGYLLHISRVTKDNL